MMVKLGSVDSVAGVVVGVAGALITVWLIAALLVATSWSTAASGIQGSRIVGDSTEPCRRFPRPRPASRRCCTTPNFPSVFASIVSPTIPSSKGAPKLGANTLSPRSPSQVVKVLAMGCPDTHQGTGFFITPHLVVTNAHVVAGATSVSVAGVDAQVALFDPVNDIAILRTSALNQRSAA